MKLKKIFSLGMLSVMLSLQSASLMAFAEGEEDVQEVELAAEVLNYELRSFVISAYYSPLPGQNRYATGSYEGDIRLNGNGTNGASGAQVFPGMIAAPKIYAFDTEFDIPGVCAGCQVQDRGGAIVPAGERGYAFDRLDIWMGWGDAGLVRALNWGKRTVHEVKVYTVSTGRSTDFFYDPSTYIKPTSTGTPAPILTFSGDIYAGESSDNVKKMQEYLVQWGYLESATGFYGDETVEALFKLQTDFGLVANSSTRGAGHFGVNTRKRFEELIKAGEGATEIIREKQTAQVLAQETTTLAQEPVLAQEPELKNTRFQFRSGLGLGQTGEEVRELQNLLNEMGYLRIESTGYFGEITEHAVYKFQQSQGLIEEVEASGAGYVGPGTRQILNKILGNRFEVQNDIAVMRTSIESGEHMLKIPSQVVVVFREED